MFNGVQTKTCTACGVPKAVNAFSSQRRGKWGVMGQCKVCKAEQERARRAANPEKVREQQRAYKAANSEKVRERERAYKTTNREKLSEKQRTRYAANPEKMRERERARYAENPEKGRELQRAIKDKYRSHWSYPASQRDRTGMKKCGGCKQELLCTEFGVACDTKDGFYPICLACSVAKTTARDRAEDQASLRQAFDSDAAYSFMSKRARKFTKEAGVKYAVDHIMPLDRSSEIQWGLHTPWNFRVITERENLEKLNKIPEEALHLDYSAPGYMGTPFYRPPTTECQRLMREWTDDIIAQYAAENFFQKAA